MELRRPLLPHCPVPLAPSGVHMQTSRDDAFCSPEDPPPGPLCSPEDPPPPGSSALLKTLLLLDLSALASMPPCSSAWHHSGPLPLPIAFPLRWSRSSSNVSPFFNHDHLISVLFNLE
ncbi:hypothetical protein FQA47_006036 [Oryzias melastigma]|uniref:Uncharacterized protein n=1 Tax=Oryzias melastigma TaxID=30732 RepID=A0A834F9R8_ORYME|nr:hypothetical protein FQA47_006036 [Oryzias melastigma]